MSAFHPIADIRSYFVAEPRHSLALLLGAMEVLMILALLLVISPSNPYSPPPHTPAGVARCIDSYAIKFAASGQSDSSLADEAFVACRGPFEQMLAARDALVTKEAGSPPSEENRAAWRASMTKSFKASALHYVQMARRGR